MAAGGLRRAYLDRGCASRFPLLGWTVGPASGSLAGRVTGQQEAGGSARAAFTAWRQALGLGDVLEIPAAGGSGTWLRASALRGRVRITVTAAWTPPTRFSGARTAWWRLRPPGPQPRAVRRS